VPNGVHSIASTVRTAIWCIYGIAGGIWFGALAFAAFRYYQMRTLTPIEAEVLNSEVDSYAVTSRDTDSNGFTVESGATVYVPVVWVRYQYNNEVYTAEARHDTGGIKWVQDRIARRWRPGARIRVHVDSAQPDKPVPDLGLNLHTFQVSIALVIAGFFFAFFGYALGSLAAYASRLFEQLTQAHAR